jgi:peptide chain release factor subunit 1
METSDIEKWRMRRMIKALKDARGNGTSMISLIIPAGDDLPTWTRRLTGEIASCVNIKSRVNRQSVQSAIEATHARVSARKQVPPNGLCVFIGNIIDSTGNEKRIVLDFEPPKPINTSLYYCDKQFHIDALDDLIGDDDSYGFLVVDGSGALYATVQGSVKNVLYSFNVELPKKHNKGGQSSVRFGRLREIARLNYLRKVTEIATQQFIKNDKPIVKGIIVAGSAEFKTKVIEDQTFDPRLKDIVISVVDVAYGGENGFNQAIDLSQELISNVKFVHEKNVISSFFNHIALDPIDATKWCFGVTDTFVALENGAVETLIIYEEMEYVRYVLVNNETVILKRNERPTSEIVSQAPLAEWLAENYTMYGTSIEIVSGKTSEGEQFIKGFGGIGGILRYPMTFQSYDNVDDINEDFDDEW